LTLFLDPTFSVVLCKTLLKCLLEQYFLLPRDLFLLLESLKFLISPGLLDLPLFFLLDYSVEVDLIGVGNHAPVILGVFLFDYLEGDLLASLLGCGPLDLLIHFLLLDLLQAKNAFLPCGRGRGIFGLDGPKLEGWLALLLFRCRVFTLLGWLKP